MRNIAILAAGFDQQQSEITETISLIVSLSELNAQFKIFALNTNYPLNHHKIYSINELQHNSFDALILPGGRGVGTLLSDWFEAKNKMQIHSQVEKTISVFHKESKPIGAICLAPILLAKTLGKHNPCLTLGEQFSDTKIIESWGASLESCPSNDFITDRNTKLVTTPAYMNDSATPFEVFSGIRALAKELVEMA